MTATWLTVDDVRQHIETALPDEAIQRFLDRGEADINEHCGRMVAGSGDVISTVTEHDYGRWRGQDILRLEFTPEIVTTVNAVDVLGVPTELLEGDDEDYVVDGRLLRRIGAKWGAHTVVVYTPRNTLSQRKGTLLQLVELQINVQPGQGFAGAATWQETFKDFETEKQHLLWALCPPPVFA